MNKKELLNPTTMGQVIATKNMMIVHTDGTNAIEDRLDIEIGMPQSYDENGRTKWVCNMRISTLNKIIAINGQTSFDAISNALYAVGMFMRNLPIANKVDMHILPNFGLPVSPFTHPDDFAEEHTRAQQASEDMRTGKVVFGVRMAQQIEDAVLEHVK
jgi:hypothetical protein